MLASSRARAKTVSDMLVAALRPSKNTRMQKNCLMRWVITSVIHYIFGGERVRRSYRYYLTPLILLSLARH